MKKIFLATGIMMVAITTFAHDSIDRKARKESRIERREARKEHRKERRTENQTEVSILTRSQFPKDFPDAKNVSYQKIDIFDGVYFTSGDKRLIAYYDYEGHLVGTTQKVTFADLPENAQNKILKEYSGFNVAAVVKFDDNEANNMDMILYGTPFDDDDNYFVELKNDNKTIVLRVDLPGNVYYFKDIQ